MKDHHADQADHSDHHHADGEASVQRIVPAKGAKWPITSAPNSVFDAGRKAKAANQPPRVAMQNITIRKGIAKPATTRGVDAGYGLVRQHGARRQRRAAHQAGTRLLRQREKRATVAEPPQRFSFRKLNDTTGAVWRDV
jgi:hypothetical protein